MTFDAAELDRQIVAIEWWRALKARSNETFLPLFFDQHRHLVLKGGGGSGKSIFAGDKVLERVTSEPGHRFLVCRKVDKSLRQSCFKQLCEQARKYYAEHIDYIPKGASSEMYMRFKNGSEIIFSGLDNVEKLKSIYNITGIWIEEASEVTEDDFDQLDIRLRGESKYYKQIILSFNPIYITHWLKRRFFDRKDERVRIHESTYKDNRFLPEEDRLTLEAYKETNPYYYIVYCLGQWGVLGKTVFDANAVQAQLAKNILPQRMGRFDFDYDGIMIGAIRFEDDDGGDLMIYELPKERVPYVIGADTAGDGSDKFVATVIDNTSGRIVAKLRQTYDEDVFSRQLYCLGKWYNDALVAIELNHSTYPQKEMERLGYTRFYVREVEDNYTGKMVQAYGFKTTSLTRPVIISELVKIVREHADLIVDRETLEEMLTFVRNEKGRPEAAVGAHDDCVMALAIAYYARTQQRAVALIDEKSGSGRRDWTEDQHEDWRNATPAERKYLEKIWGDA